jgi:hypothetical protein
VAGALQNRSVSYIYNTVSRRGQSMRVMTTLLLLRQGAVARGKARRAEVTP